MKTQVGVAEGCAGAGTIGSQFVQVPRNVLPSKSGLLSSSNLVGVPGYTDKEYSPLAVIMVSLLAEFAVVIAGIIFAGAANSSSFPV